MKMIYSMLAIMFKVDNKDARRRSGVFIINFEYNS